MNTSQIGAVLQRDPFSKALFQGVFPSDQLPIQVQRYPACFVANVDPKGRPGSHWCAFYFTQDQQGEFFDSYGRKPHEYTQAFKDFIERNSKQWTYNEQCLQSLNSNVCGHYCLFYIMCRCRRVSMKTIVNRFSKNTVRNDSLVYRFITKHFGFLFHSLRKKYMAHQTAVVKKTISQ